MAFAGGAAMFAGAVPAASHPHIFAEASLEVVVTAEGAVDALRHVWRFDDLFSSTVLLEFDKNADLELDHAELETVGGVIHESLAEFGYFQFVTAQGKDVSMTAPDKIVAMYQDSQLVILFESKPAEPLELDGTVDFGVYDPTFYTAIDFYNDDSVTVTNLPDGCNRAVVRPDPDEALAMNQQSLTDDFFNDPTGNDVSKLFATRLEIDCTARG
ncbi:DUF1007 family protein [Mesorhizobium sp. CAU 1741]|uniref:DUF1007 family protein n=1 Tax=Mesorhizobium sp. CAU 1741 TaxID=3140366 RepID=UPI00325C0969